MPFESWRERVSTVETEVYALALASRDPRSPFAAKLVVALVVAYAVSPLDLIPDVVPVLGYVDDLVVLPLGVALARRLVPDELMDEYRERATDERPAGRARWVAAVVVLFVWVLVGLLALHLLTDWA